MFCQNDVMKYFREDLHRRLLSTDFKKQVDGIEMLQKVFLVIVHGSLSMIFEYAPLTLHSCWHFRHFRPLEGRLLKS